jgi:hypothetical protein
MTYSLYDSRGYVGDLASGGGLEDMESFLGRYGEPFKSFFKKGYAENPERLIDFLVNLKTTDKMLQETLDNFRNLLENCHDIAIISDGTESIEYTAIKHGGPGSGHFGHEGRPGEVGGGEPGEGGGSSGGGGSDKVTSAAEAGFRRYGSTDAGEDWPSDWDEGDKSSAFRSAAREGIKPISWREPGDPHDIATKPPVDKPYASVTFHGRDTGYDTEISVANSYNIKDDLKSRGYKYSDREWYFSGDENDLGGVKSEIDYLKSKGIVTKFGKGVGNSYHPTTIDVILGRDKPSSTSHTDFMGSLTSKTPKAGINTLTSKISSFAKQVGVDEN